MNKQLAQRWIDRTRAKSRGRTRFEGQEPYDDEAVVDYVDRLTARVAELEGIVNALPKTVDGVVVVPGMWVCNIHGVGGPATLRGEYEEYELYVSGDWGVSCKGSEVYSTEQAARAALGEGSGHES